MKKQRRSSFPRSVPKSVNHKKKRNTETEDEIIGAFFFWIVLPILFLFVIGYVKSVLPDIPFILVITILTAVFGYLISYNVHKRIFQDEQKYPFWTLTIAIVVLLWILYASFNLVKLQYVFSLVVIGAMLIGFSNYYRNFLITRNEALLNRKRKLIEEISKFHNERKMIMDIRLNVEKQNNDLIDQNYDFNLDKQTTINDYYVLQKVNCFEKEIDTLSNEIEKIDVSVLENAKKTLCHWITEEKKLQEKEKHEAFVLWSKIRELRIKKDEDEEERRRQWIFEEGRRLEELHRIENETKMKQHMKQKQDENGYFRDLYR
jgi:signal transduction histidine kinase